MRMLGYFRHLLVLCLVGISVAASQSIVETLPGFDGPLPFKLETGYIWVRQNKETFYYFVESENDPTTDPLLVWLPGGCGCSALSSMIFENGPFTFDLENFDGSSIPKLVSNPYSWSKFANIIFLDTPAGTGFSYLNSSLPPSTSSDTETALDNYIFLQKWFKIHPSFLRNRLFITGDSFGGKMAPLFAFEIVRGNEAGLRPKMPLQGYIVGNPTTNDQNKNSRVILAHRLGLISDEQFESARSRCDGEYKNVNPRNKKCVKALEVINECLDGLYSKHILEPKCPSTSAISSDSGLLLDQPLNLLTLSNPTNIACRDDIYVTSEIWANDESVRESLHIRKGTKNKWVRCWRGTKYTIIFKSIVDIHQLLAEKGIQGLIYSGDHDMVIPYVGTLKWINELNITLEELWRPWTVEGQVAGYTETYKHTQSQGSIVFATVKGAGHTAPEYRPKECSAMVHKWLSSYSL